MSEWWIHMSDTMRNNQRPAFYSCGFTFLEVMIALSIMAIVLVSIYRLQSQTALMSIRSRFDTLAPLLAQQKLSQLESDPREVKSGEGDFGDLYPGYVWRISINKVTSEPLGSVAESIKQIDLQIALQDGESVYNIRVYRIMEAP